MSIDLQVDKRRKDGELTDSEILRLAALKKKQEEQLFQLAFCGHFSAGKSTIINQLLGAEILPTSPIPTSANIIGIKHGELGLTLVDAARKSRTFEGEVPWQRVREWGMNGADIAEITIHAPLAFLGNNSAIYDTPGVDSTDPTHQQMTLAALDMTDFIVYVMEYNHVQSETNLYFLKQLSDEQKPLIIVINQIDKHNEKELSFESFDETVRKSFSSWGIEALKLYYTSMREPTHRLNQFQSFAAELKGILQHGAELSSHSEKKGYSVAFI